MRLRFSALLLSLFVCVLVSCDGEEQSDAPIDTPRVEEAQTPDEVAVATATVTRTPLPTLEPSPFPTPTLQGSPTPEASATPAATETAQPEAATEEPATAESTATVQATASPESVPSPTFSAQAAEMGQQLFGRQGCDTCHPGGQGGTGPPLIGLFGEQVALESGETVIADTEYIRRSILHPSEQIVAGYQDLMPSFSDLDESQVRQLIAFILSLSE